MVSAGIHNERGFCVLSYALKSLQRQTGRYIRILGILALAMIIPILVNIVGASSLYGGQQQSQAMTHGMDYRIDEVTKGLADRFLEDDRFDVFQDGGSIFLRYHSQPGANDGGTENHEGNDSFRSEASRAIHAVLDEAGMSSLQVYDITALARTDSHTSEFMNQINILSFAIILVSVMIFRAGYKAHISAFGEEVSSLYSIGCSYRKICLFFFWTLTVCFIIAYITAVLIAYGLMSILYTSYLNVQGNGYSWMLFHVDWQSILMMGLMWYLLLLVVYFIRMLSQYRDLNGRKAHPGKSRRTFSASGIEKVPVRLLWGRHGQILYHGIILAVLTVFLTVFIVNYASINAEAITEDNTADFSISHRHIVAGLETGISEEFRQGLQEIRNIRVTWQKDAESIRYLAAAPHRHSNYAVLESGDVEYIAAFVFPYPGAQNNESYSEDHCIPVWINPYQPDSNWSVGDIIELYVYDPASLMNQAIPNESAYGHPFLTGRISLKVCGYVDEKYMDTPLRLFFYQQDYDKLTEKIPVVSANILVESDADKNAVKSQLISLLADYPDYEFLDIYGREQTAKNGSTGIYILASIITILFLLVISLVIWILFTEYVIQMSEVNKLLFLLGLSADNLKQVYRKISCKAYIITMLIGVIAAVATSAAFFAGTGYRFAVTLPNIIIYLLMLMVIFAAMTIPMQKEIIRQIRKEEAV